MYTGWLLPFPSIGRSLTQAEQDTTLQRVRQPGVAPEQNMGLVRINSTYIDWIDRRFLFRGAMPMCLVVAFFLFMAYVFLAISIKSINNIDIEGVIIYSVLMIFFVFVLYGVLRFVLLKDFFSYTHWPIRFNRKTRMIHVFRHNGEDGVLSVPWDDVVFHFGEGSSNRPNDIDIRGELLDGEVVRDAFALGHTVPKTQLHMLYEMWEFIRRYMDEGPEAVATHPLERYVELSVSTSLVNCFLIARTYYAAGLPVVFQILTFPIVLFFTLMRWLVLFTCRKPVFPPEVEATCQVEPNDPNVWPIPKSAGQFARTVPGLFEHAMEKEQHKQKDQQSALSK